MRSTPRLGTGKKIARALVVMCAILAVGEVACRIALVSFFGSDLTAANPTASSYSVRPTPKPQHILTSSSGFVHDTPLEFENSPNTVRILLFLDHGGSAAFGAGQASESSRSRDYPDGLHAYRPGIAGQLEAHLEQQRPDLEFEVVNAANYSEGLQQSLPDHLATISRLDPDYVINMNGYGYVAPVSGTPFPKNLGMYRVLAEGVRRLTPFDTALSVSTDRDPPEVRAPKNRYEYARLLGRFVENTDRYLEILNDYMTVLRRDNVGFLLVLTPWEMEWRCQTKRSGHERGARNFRYILRYFFDDHLSDALERRIAKAGHGYIDMDRAIRNVDSPFRATDHCRLTVEGNEFVAGQMGRFVLNHLSTTRVAEAGSKRDEV